MDSKKLFTPGLCTLKEFLAKIHIYPLAAPKFCKARPVPYAMRSEVERELRRMLDEGRLKLLSQ